MPANLPQYKEYIYGNSYALHLQQVPVKSRTKLEAEVEVLVSFDSSTLIWDFPITKFHRLFLNIVEAICLKGFLVGHAPDSGNSVVAVESRFFC